MEPIFGFMLYFAAVIVVSVVAAKRGLKWWYYALFCVVIAPMLVRVIVMSGGTSLGAAFGAFLVPVGSLFMALASNTSEREAVVSGEAGEYKKCPFCAEAVRKEAIKCKHCGSELT